MSPDDFRAAAEVHRELGPDYSDAVVESFFAKIDNEIGARIDARLGQTSRTGHEPNPVAVVKRRSFSTGVVVGLGAGAAGAGIPLTWFILRLENAAGFPGWSGDLQVIWAAIALVIAVCAGRRLLARAVGSLAAAVLTKLSAGQPESRPGGLPGRPSTR